jgi:hypothetical protein
MKQILDGNGRLQDLKEWQQFRGIKGDKLSANFNASEFDCEGELIISEVLIDFLQVLRDRWGKSLLVNYGTRRGAGYRTDKKQAELKAQGFKTATITPHKKGMAADLDTFSADETKKLAALAERFMKLPIRIGYKQYLNAGQTFVHIDVCPHYFAKGRPLHDFEHPSAWEIPYLSW